jgi:5'-nucleotidase
LIVLVDQDGVLANFEKGHSDQCKALGYGAHIVAEMRDYWQLLDGLTREEVQKVLDVWYTPGFFLNLEPLPGAVATLHEWKHQGHEVFICTTPMKGHRTCAHEKEEWVKKYLGSEFVGRLIMTHDKTMVHGDLLIDDKPEITGAREPHWEHIIYDQRYNRGVTHKRRITWQNWREIL